MKTNQTNLQVITDTSGDEQRAGYRNALRACQDQFLDIEELAHMLNRQLDLDEDSLTDDIVQGVRRLLRKIASDASRYGAQADPEQIEAEVERLNGGAA